MKLKAVLFGATALGLLMATGAVYAGDDNQTTVWQHGGSNNSALVLQNTGSHNSAGTTDFNTSGFLVESNGSNNTITINQQYDANSIGKENTIYKENESDPAGYGYGGIDIARVAPYTTGQHGLSGNPNGILGSGWDDYVGVHQNGNNNNLNVTQVGALGYNDTAGNDIVGVMQNGYAGATDTTNDLTITQTNYGARAFNWVGVVTQTNVSGYQGSWDNSATISQYGGGYNAGNRVFVALQSGYDNKLSLTQTGTNNIVTTSEQDGDGNGGGTGAHNAITITQSGSQNWIHNVAESGNNNTAIISQTGTNNEVDNLTMLGNNNGLGQGYFTGDAALVASDDMLGKATQSGTDNYINDPMIGDFNEFAFSQSGSSNSIDGYVVGSYNQVAVVQNGAGNSAKFGQEGGNNNIGIQQ